MQGLHKPPQEAPTVAQVLLNYGDQVGPQRLEEVERAQVGAGDVVEAVVHPVDDEGLVGVEVEVERGEEGGLGGEGVELEGQAEGGGEVGELAAGGLEEVEGGAEAGEAEGVELVVGLAEVEDVE
ncbi:hypothetical protein Sjap_003759 [Stephania japonica]|uniref:Uncharacterized protein n=1 Tax=Stephania japonica TaxID=461633 RepID=A0AAP0PVT6_9MAGN